MGSWRSFSACNSRALGWRCGVGDGWVPTPPPRPALSLGLRPVAWRPRHRTSCNPSWAGLGALGPRSGGAGAFLGGHRLGKTRSVGRAERLGKRAVGSSSKKPVGDAPAPRPRRRAGAEGWVFAGEMRVSVQLAYKVPVLGPQDRQILRAPGRLGRSPALRRECELLPGATSRGHTGEGAARGPRRGLCGRIRGMPVLRRNGGNVLRTLSRSLCAIGGRSVFFGWSRFPPGRTWGGGWGGGVERQPTRACPAALPRAAALSLEVGRITRFLELLPGRWPWMWRFSLCGGGRPCPSLPPPFV